MENGALNYDKVFALGTTLTGQCNAGYGSLTGGITAYCGEGYQVTISGTCEKCELFWMKSTSQMLRKNSDQNPITTRARHIYSQLTVYIEMFVFMLHVTVSFIRAVMTSVAVGKPAKESTTAVVGNPAGVAVDGNRDTSWFSGSCTHTSFNDFSPWWRVDLLAVYHIITVRMVNRGDPPEFTGTHHRFTSQSIMIFDCCTSTFVHMFTNARCIHAWIQEN